MTPPQQPKEYIITEEQLHRLTGDIITFEEAAPIEKAIRSRPSPAPAHQWTNERVKEIESNAKMIKDHLPKGFLLEMSRQISEQHDAAIRAEAARQAREKALKVIADGKSALYEIELDGHWSPILQAKMDVLCWVEESLRQEPPAP